MTTLPAALRLASLGYHVFPCQQNKKIPAIADFPNQATTDPELIAEWWERNPEYNVGISTSHFGVSQALVVVDVDVKNGKDGNKTAFLLDMEGFDLPVTVENATPSGGKHLIYVTECACKQGVDVLGEGLDIRSRGGYILAPGSSLDGKPYAQINGHGSLTECPGWLVDRLGRDTRTRSASRAPLPGVDADRASGRAVAYLNDHAPLAIEGQAGDLTTFKVAAHLKDLGCDEDQAAWLMVEWNERCCPPWAPADLLDKVAHAFRYGSNPQGSAAPEAAFPALPPAPPAVALHPFAEMNTEFAYVKKGCFILQETTDPKGSFTTEHLALNEFHGWFANQPFQTGKGKPRPISEWWLEWADRRQYEGVVFMPEQDAGPRWYNLWRGFNVKPVDGLAQHKSLDLFLEHALDNVCNGDKKLCLWLLGYFAHMIQRPWEKPLVALVFKGKKGTGKNALVERVGSLLGSHFLVADDDRYLLSNFNAHLESNLFFVLDEAAWAGDKKAEGKLKGLITGQQNNIERKGKEPYRVDNLCRVAIIGNEKWLVPASQDERRFAVFDLGNGRLQDRQFFIDMREGMERGGYAHLLRYLLDFDLSQVDVNDAPKTKALIDQKHASLDTVEQWWLDCLHSGQIAGGDWGGEWPETVPTNRLREAMCRWARGRNIRSRLPEEVGFGRIIAQIAGSLRKKKSRSENLKDTSYAFINPGLEVLRADWEKHIGGEVDWED